MLRVFALSLALVLAGCIGGAEPEAESAASDAVAPAAAEAAASEAAAELAADAAPVARAFPVSFSGRTGLWVCAPSGPSSCSDLPAGTPSENTWVTPSFSGVPSAVDLTLSWTASTPATNEMYVGVLAVRSCGESCFEHTDGMFSSWASGTSPVVLAAADVRLAPDEVLYVHVGTIDPTPSLPAPLFYSLEQAFAVEGTLTAMVPPG